MDRSTTTEELKTRFFLPFSRSPERLLTWISIVASLISVTGAVASFVLATRPPEVSLIAPRQIRVAQGEAGALLYVQPTFLSSGRNQRAEVILDMKLQVEPAEGGSPAEFGWDEQGRWSYDRGSQELTWEFVSDPGPLMVTRETPQSPIALFVGPVDWVFDPGTYRITLIAERGVAQAPARQRLEIHLSPEDIEILNRANGRRFLSVPANRLPAGAPAVP